jgi:hypothetical protein
MKMKSSLIKIGAAVAMFASSAFGERADDAFKRSLQESIDQSVDPSKLIAFAAAVLGSIILLALISKWRGKRPRQSGPKTINSPGKLIREICKNVNLKPAEVKQLKSLCEQQKIGNPLVLLLCPSVLGKAVKENQKKLDRAVLGGLAKKIARAP